MNTPRRQSSLLARVTSGANPFSAAPPSRSLATSRPAGAAGTDICHYPTPLGFVSLMSALRPSGGVARGDDLSFHLDAAEPGYLTQLARQIVSGGILSFQWRQSFWVPLFQFEAGTARVKSCVSQVLQELTPAFDSWETVVWFIQPHALLNSERPLDVLADRFDDVVQAARNDRFVAMG